MIKIMEAEVFQCSCKSEFQDEVYGKGNRLFNPKGKGEKVDGYRCTVCGREIRIGEGKKK
jgi:CRISPR/Cas system-associated protein Cas10 (large subunit of type III CRISPR-Cas system)